MKKKLIAVGMAVVLVLTLGSGVALAAFGDVVTSFTPAPAGNGRAIAYDGTDLYYTYYGSTYIYKVDTSGTAISSWDAGVQIGALAWDSSQGKLWAGAYDGTGDVYLVDYGVGKTWEFAFDPEVGPHFDGYIDGLDYDEDSDTLYISEDWDHKVYHISTAGTILHSWNVTIPGYDYLDNSGLEKVNKWLLVGHPAGTPHGPAANKIYVFELDETWGLNYTGQSIDANGGVEGLALGKYDDQCVLWTNNAGTNTLVAYEMTGYCPVLVVDKWILQEIDLGDGDGVLEVGEIWWWNVVIEIQNVSVGTINDIVIQDNFGGDLQLEMFRHSYTPDPWLSVPAPANKKDTWVDPETGDFSVLWTGKTLKAHIWWEVGDLAPGEAALIQIVFATDINTGTGNGKKPGHQEFTSEGPTELNSGATAKGLLQGWYEVEAVTLPLEVDVQPYVETIP